MSLTSFGETQPSLAWDFNGTTRDYVSGLVPTSIGGSPTYVAGKYNQGLNFPNSINTGTSNPTNNVVYTVSLNATTGFTFAFWVNFNVGGIFAQQILSLADAAGSRVFWTYLNNSNRLICGGTPGDLAFPTITLSTGIWYHIALVVVGGNRTAYINGQSTTSATTFTGNAAKFSIGGDVWVSNFSAWCSYDDLRVFDRALTSSQVQSIYNQQGMPGRGTMFSNDRQIYVAPVGTYPSYTPTSGAQFPVFNTSNVSFYSSGGTSGGTVGQYLAFGSQTFNMARGFSAVCQFAWTNGIGVWERILDFGIGTNNNNILLTRTGTSTNLLFSYRIGGTEYYVTAVGSIPAQNTLYTVVAIYDPSKPLLSLYVNGTLTSSIPAVVARDTRTLTQTYVGRSNWGSDAYSNVNINYLSIYNRVLTPDEINRPLPTPQITLKGAPLFNQLSQSAASSAVGAFSLRAVNGVTAKAVQVRPQGQFPPGPMTANSTPNIPGYSFGGSGTYTASSSTGTAWSAFDYNTSTFWQTTGSPSNLTYETSTLGGDYIGSASTTVDGSSVNGEWIQIQLPIGVVIASYSMYARSGFLSRMARNFTIAGSNDNGASWTTVDTETNQTSWVGQTPITFTVTSSTAYTYYRLIVTAVVGQTSGNERLNIAGLTYFGTPSGSETDFYADERGNLLTAPVVGTSLQNWLGGATGYVTKWYDQSGKGNDAIQDTAAKQPIIQRATKGPGYMCVFSGAQSLSSSTLSLYNTPYSFATCERTTAIGTVTFSVNRNPVFSYSGGTISTNGSLYYGRISTGSQYALDQVSNSLDPPNVTAFTNSVSEPLRYHYGMKSAASAWKKYIYNDPLGPLTATNTDTVLVNSNTGKTFNIGYLYLDTGVTNYYYGEIYELLVFTQSLYDLDGTTSINQIYNNQLSAYGT